PGVQLLDVAIKGHSGVGANLCDLKIAVTDAEGFRIASADFKIGVRHGLTEINRKHAKSQIAPVVGLIEFGAYGILVRPRFKKSSGTGVIDRSRRPMPQRLMGTEDRKSVV